MLVGPAYEVCDDDYDGIGSYDLRDETLLDGQTGVSISYYESQEDADNATNVLDVNYQNTRQSNTLCKTRSRRNWMLRYYYTRSNRSSYSYCASRSCFTKCVMMMITTVLDLTILVH